MRRAWCCLALGVLAFIAAPTPLAAEGPSAELIVGATPNDSGGTPYYAQALGLFKKHGLNVKLESFENPGAVAAAVVGGSLTIGTLTIPGIAVAREKGLPLVIVAPSAVYSSTTPTSGIIVLNNSPISAASDLDGKTIATRDIGNLSYYGALYWVDKNGGSSKTLKWVEINDTATVPALLSRRIDAASVSEPAFDDAIHSKNARMLAPIYDAIGNRFLIGASFATAQYAKEHPDVVRRFDAAIIEAGIWANGHRALSAKILEKISGAPVPPNTTRVTYAERLCPSDVQPVLSMLEQYGALKVPLRAADLIAPALLTTACSGGS